MQALFPRAKKHSSVAPSYDEILRDIDRIVKRDANPQGPAVNMDGLADPEIREAWSSYVEMMVGKRVEGWKGWYSSYTEIGHGVSYNVHINMEKMELGQRTFKMITLQPVTADQLEEVKKWREGQPLVFSGTITGIAWDGQVWLDNSMVEPVR